MLEILWQSFESVLNSEIITNFTHELKGVSDWVENTIKNLLDRKTISYTKESFSNFKNRAAQAIMLLAAFYAMLALPVLGPILHFVLGTTQGTILQTLGSYLRHIGCFGAQAVAAYYFKPNALMNLGNDFLRQAYAFPLALLMGSFSRQVMFIAQPFVTLISFYAGSGSVAAAIVSLGAIGLAALPIFLISNYNNSAESKKPGVLNTFSISQLVMMSYSSFIGACFPQFSFGESRLSPMWRTVGALTGACNELRMLQGHAAVDSAYNHFVGLSVPLGGLSGIIFSQPSETNSAMSDTQKNIPLTKQ